MKGFAPVVRMTMIENIYACIMLILNGVWHGKKMLF